MVVSLVLASSITAIITPLLGDDIVLEGQPQRGTLIELYSSEGCSSCPPAEKWMSELKNDPRLWRQVIPVVFHVDYWDGLGWPDRFARTAYTQRQGDYQARWHAANVYTPEFIVDAREWHGWFDGDDLPMAKTEMVGPLRIVINRDTGDVKVTHALIDSTVAPHLTVNVAWLGMNIDSDVRGGENNGRNLVHDFVVLDFQSKPASFAADKGISGEFPGPKSASGADHSAAIAAWLSLDDGTIYQATGGLLK